MPFKPGRTDSIRLDTKSATAAKSEALKKHVTPLVSIFKSQLYFSSAQLYLGNRPGNQRLTVFPQPIL